MYDQAYENALLELGLDARGVAVTERWEVDTAVLRSWLRKLRMICTHPQVGQLQSHADRLHKPGVLKTIGEVLGVSFAFCHVGFENLKILNYIGNEGPKLAQFNG